MAEKADFEYFKSAGLLPYGAEFASDFVRTERGACWELVAPAGAGKTRVGSAIIAYELECTDAKRTLVLCPAALVWQWRDAIEEATSLCLPQAVDRETYLELEAKVAPGECPWPSPGIVVMSIDLAKRDDMAPNLTRATWNLVVVDESHLLRGKRRQLLDQMRKAPAPPRVLLLTATPGEPLPASERRVLNREDIADWKGNPLYPPIERKTHMVDYERTEAERACLAQLQAFTTQLSRKWPYGRVIAMTLLRIASSSIDATERALRRLHDAWRPMRNKLAHGVAWTEDDFERIDRQLKGLRDEPTVLVEPSTQTPRRPDDFLALYQALESLLDGLDDLGLDSKLEAALDYVQRCVSVGDKRWMCIWTSFVATAELLNSCLSQIDRPVYCITGSLSMAERREQETRFRDTGGVLITTDVSSEGTTFEYVDFCVNYEIPWNPSALEQRWGRFLRLGRRQPFVMVALRDQSRALALESRLWRALQKATTERENGQ